MAIKYSIKYFDTENVQHTFTIDDDTYVGDAIPVSGRVNLDVNSSDNVLEAIRGAGLRVALEADTTLNYEDLFSEEDKTFRVKYKRDSVLLFDGWLDSSGWYENWVQDSWLVSFDCIDGLGYLKDLAFVSDINKKPFTRKMNMLSVVQQCLLRTGIVQDLYVDIQIYYDGAFETLGTLEQNYINPKRYMKSDKITVMDCDEVLKDVLECFSSVITSYNGAWYIYKPNQLFNSSIATFRGYLINSGTPTSVAVDLSATLGSDINGFYPHHSSGNQSISNKKSLGAYRISYKYGFTTSYIDNDTFLMIYGSYYTDWTILSGSNIDLPLPGESGLPFIPVLSTGSRVAQIRNNTLSVAGDIEMTFNIGLVNTIVAASYSVEVMYTITVSDLPIGTAGAKTKYLNQQTMEWGIDNVVDYIKYGALGNGVFNFTHNSAPKPTGYNYVNITIYTPVDTGRSITNRTTFTLASIAPTGDSASLTFGGNGETHTFQRQNLITSKVKDTKEVFTGDNASDLYVGSIYKLDQVSKTSTWHRKGVTESKPLLQIMGEETMRMNQNTMRVFSGDVYGYIPYMSVVSIDGISGKYMFIEYSYDTKANITSMVLQQLHGEELTEGDIYYSYSVDRGETTKPTIIG